MTERERDARHLTVLDLYAAGWSMGEIGKLLGLSRAALSGQILRDSRLFPDEPLRAGRHPAART